MGYILITLRKFHSVFRSFYYFLSDFIFPRQWSELCLEEMKVASLCIHLKLHLTEIAWWTLGKYWAVNHENLCISCMLNCEMSENEIFSLEYINDFEDIWVINKCYIHLFACAFYELQIHPNTRSHIIFLFSGRYNFKTFRVTNKNKGPIKNTFNVRNSWTQMKE